MVTASRVQISGAAISIAFGLAISVASCIDLTVDPGSSGDPEWTSSSSAASSSSSSSSTSSSSSSGGGSSSSSSSGNPVAVCGDALISVAEECDDGNTKPGDGCSPFCTLENPKVCPGPTIPLALGESLVLFGTTADASDKVASSKSGLPNSNCSAGNFPGPDAVYQVIPGANGTLTATLDPDYSDPWLHIRSACPGGAGDELACRYIQNNGNAVVTISALVGGSYYVVPDSWNNKSGSFTLTLSLQ